MKTEIKNVFSIGYRCNTDDLLKMLKIREYSSPFSYMVINLETAMKFINNNFKDFHDVELIDNMKLKYYKWNGKIWNHKLFFNKNTIDDNKINEITKWNNICVWNHHDLENKKVLKSMRRRINKFNERYNSHTTLLVYTCKPINNVAEIDINNINHLIGHMKCKFLVLVPVLDIKEDIITERDKENIYIYFKTFQGNYGTDVNDERIKWDDICKEIKNIYNFNIEKA